MALLGRAQRRHFQRHPLQLMLAILGIALGVAMWVSVDLAIDSSRRAFALSMEALMGRTTHHIIAADDRLDENLYPALRRLLADATLAPAVEGLVEAEGQTLRLIGRDPFAEAPARAEFRRSGAEAAALELLTEPGTVLISRITAQRLGIVPGSLLQLNVEGVIRTVRVLGYPDPPGQADPGLEGVMLADIATAQEVLGRIGWLDRIDAILPATAVEDLRRRLPPGTELVDAAGRVAATAHMSHAFEINLRAMSLLALLVGTFLIYNTMSFAVLQRRRLLADLRTLGVTRGELLREILGEAAVLGIVGGAAGLMLGLWAAEFLVQRVTQTINDVYFVLTVTQFTVSPGALTRGLALGLLAALAASLPAAMEAARVNPVAAQRRSGLETGVRRRVPLLTLAGLGLAALGALIMNLTGGGLVIAIGGLFLVLTGYALMTPGALVMLAAGATRLPPIGARLAVRGVAAALSRTGAAVAALTVAVATAVGVGLMVASFQTTVSDWLEQLLQADFYLARPAEPGRASPPLPEELIAAASALPDVERVGLARRAFVESAVGRIEVLATRPADPERPGFRFKDAAAGTVWKRFLTEDVLLISEPFATRHGLRPGDTLRLVTPTGPRDLPVIGVFFDYRSDQGLALLRGELYERLWNDSGASSLGIHLKPGAPLAPTRAALDRLIRGQGGLLLRSNREIREASMEVFHRTFAITHVLRLLAIAVAFVGIVSALLALQLERGREFAVLRALGLTPRQLAGLVLAQTGFLGLAAGLLALPLGVLLAYALVAVINLRSFGWTMDLALAPGILAEAPVLALAAALLGGLYPAVLATRMQVARSLREE